MKSYKQIKDIILDLAKDGKSVKSICKIVNISRTTFYKWLKQDEDFSEGYENSRLSISFNLKTKIEESIADQISKYDGSVGYVYLIKCIGFDYYKIGISKNDPNNRLSCLQSGCPFELAFEHVSYTPSYRELEVQLHAKYKDKRVRGEWFLFEHNELDEVIKAMDSQAKQLKLF